jgi:alkylated DNA repair dioxygenase AlkB
MENSRATQMHDDELRRIGYIYLPEALTPAEQAGLVEAIDKEGRWEQDYERLAQRHGYRYEYKSRTLTRTGPLAPWVRSWAEAAHERRWMSSRPDQVTVQWYEPGTGIADHCDDRQCFGPEIATISLLAPCTYRLHYPGSKQAHTQVLEPGCVVLLSGEARAHWKHDIPKTKATRIGTRRLSVTFRTVDSRRVRAA